MPTLALSMILKNAAADLRECLASAEGVVDEIVVADTGSADATREIANAAGARVIQIPWEDDFAAARNRCLAEVKAGWVLVLDADERLDPRARSEMAAHLAPDAPAGYQVTIRNYLPSLACKIWDRPAQPNNSDYAPAREYPAYVEHENVRLFRRDPEVYFTCRVHETVGNRIVELGRRLGKASFLIHHFGMVRDAGEAARKAKLYRRLGLRKLAEMPHDAQAYFELGIVELENMGNVSEALRYFERAAELKPRFGVAWFFIAKCQFQQRDYAKALASLERAEAAGHKTGAVAELMGDTQYNAGEFERACSAYQIASGRMPPSATVESKLGLAEVRSNRKNSGLQRLRTAIEREPANGELQDRLVMAEVWLRHLPEAAEAAEKKLAYAAPRAEDFMRAASIRAQLGEWDRAAETLRDGLLKFPDSESLRASLSNAETLSPAAAAPSFKK
jgi:glycosyltransferase involved in cell wall biosynthesis